MTRKTTKITQWNSYFDLAEHTVRVSGSNLTGHEYVYLDDELVSKKLNWTFKSSHQITLNGQDYVIVIELLSVMTPQIRVQLVQGGQVIDEDYIFKNDGSARRHSLAHFGVGLLGGFVGGYLTFKLLFWIFGG